jgi:murein DD-endopeptidase MepM/ murein hydrolase activator NlpD
VLTNDFLFSKSKLQGYVLLLKKNKKITIFLADEGKEKIRQFKFPRIFAYLVPAFALLSILFLFLGFQDYLSLKEEHPRALALEKENSLQKEQILHMAHRLDQIAQGMSELRELDQKLRTMVNFETAEGEFQSVGVGGSDPALLDPKRNLSAISPELIRAMHRNLGDLSSEIEINRRDKIELFKFLDEQKNILASTPSVWPAKGWISSRFGYRSSPFANKREFHKGLDISARMGSPVVASADGIVAFSGTDRGFGRVITIKHGYGLKTKYAHMKKLLVRKGQFVKRGEIIGLVGSSGRSTGSHLHYEVHLNGVPVNPKKYIID